MGDEVLAIGAWTTNAELIEAVASLGYFNARGETQGTVLDATYGKHGGFWKAWKPDQLTTNDLRHPADHAWDFRAMPVADCAFDVVVFDPDYKLSGTPALDDFDERYGVDENLSRDERMEKIRAGAVECFRVCRYRLMVKCMDQVESGRMWWQTDMVRDAIVALGGRKVARFDIPTAGLPQPTDKPCKDCGGHGMTVESDGDYEGAGAHEIDCETCQGTGRTPRVQRNPRMKHSTLLVFEKPAKLRSNAGQTGLL